LIALAYPFADLLIEDDGFTATTDAIWCKAHFCTSASQLIRIADLFCVTVRQQLIEACAIEAADVPARIVRVPLLNPEEDSFAAVTVKVASHYEPHLSVRSRKHIQTYTDFCEEQQNE
jgi:hypothetical protein